MWVFIWRRRSKRLQLLVSVYKQREAYDNCRWNASSNWSMCTCKAVRRNDCKSDCNRNEHNAIHPDRWLTDSACSLWGTTSSTSGKCMALAHQWVLCLGCKQHTQSNASCSSTYVSICCAKKRKKTSWIWNQPSRQLEHVLDYKFYHGMFLFVWSSQHWLDSHNLLRVEHLWACSVTIDWCDRGPASPD